MAPIIRTVRKFFVGKEPLVFVAALAIVGGIWFIRELYEGVRDGGAMSFDARILTWFRRPGDLGQLRGPWWVEGVVRDITSLGGPIVLTLVVLTVTIFLKLVRRYHMMWLVLVATIGATAINSSIKAIVDRPRPAVVPQLTKVTHESFPSGHSAMSAAVYLTLGSLLAQTVSRRAIKFYFLGVALTLTFMVGVSRVMLGVHYPTDVLAGWATGLVWALLCWLVARYLQRRGAIEKEEDPTLHDNDDTGKAEQNTL